MSENKILQFKPRPKPDPNAGTNVIGFNSEGQTTINGKPVDNGSSGWAGFVYETEVKEPA